jgi:hypothetical protein
MTYDDNADRMVRLFIDGQEVSYAAQSRATGALASDAPSELDLGRRTNGARYFRGRLDDVRIFARRLSLAEIAALARDDPAPNPPPPDRPLPPTLLD